MDYKANGPASKDRRHSDGKTVCGLACEVSGWLHEVATAGRMLSKKGIELRRVGDVR